MAIRRVPRSSAYAPGSYNPHLSLHCTSPFNEKVVFEEDDIKVLSFVNFGGHNLTVPLSNFGKITRRCRGSVMPTIAVRAVLP